MAPKSRKMRRAGSSGSNLGEGATPPPEGDPDFAADDSGRTANALLVSDSRSPNIKMINFSLSIKRTTIVEDTEIDFRKGGRYGLIGRNGCGKSTFLKCIAAREVPIPSIFDIFLLSHEAAPGEETALEYVINPAHAEIQRIEKLIEEALTEDPNSAILQDLYERLDELDPSTFESRASIILRGLGFQAAGASLSKGGATVDKKTKDMSGGWRMRVALARALFVAPSILLLDEPTNHLDLETCVWLEGYLAEYKKILIMCCHSQDFLNGVCTDILVMSQKKLKHWTGNYDTYMKTKSEVETNQIKAYKKQQEDIEDIKKFIASCGTFANLVKQAQSRQKILDKMEAAGLITMPYVEPIFRFRFHDAGGKPDSVLVSASDCAFSYTGKVEDYLFKKVDFGIWPSSRIALVGPNGAGKSTLIKLICGEHTPCEGTMSRASSLTIGRFHQHSAEVLDLEMSPVDYIASKFSHKFPANRTEEWRAVVGTYGIPSELHLEPIKYLSDGLKTRLVLCEISMRMPHILLFDEPTNAADMEMIDSMADAIRNFNGGVVVISHDFRLLQQVVQEIWIIDHGIKKWDGDILSYKAELKKKFGYTKKA